MYESSAETRLPKRSRPGEPDFPTSGTNRWVPGWTLDLRTTPRRSEVSCTGWSPLPWPSGRWARWGAVTRVTGLAPITIPMAERASIGLASFTVSGTYAEPGTGAFRTERAHLIFECRYCGLEIVLDDSDWRHQMTGDAQCQPVNQAVPQKSA
jgi:hypothetical protein